VAGEWESIFLLVSFEKEIPCQFARFLPHVHHTSNYAKIFQWSFPSSWNKKGIPVGFSGSGKLNFKIFVVAAYIAFP